LEQGEMAKPKKPIPKALTNLKNTEGKADEKLFYMGKRIFIRAWPSIQQKTCWRINRDFVVLHFIFESERRFDLFRGGLIRGRFRYNGSRKNI
jgi:hypothetical protein